MALVAHCDPDIRVYKPSLIGCEYPSREDERAIRSDLLEKIRTFYRKALRRLKVKEKRLFLRVGSLCLGLLDPVSNILANILIVDHAPDREEHMRGSRRQDAAVPDDMLRMLAAASLDAMVAFLTRLFPYLAECQALRYLLHADADLLVASRVVLGDLGMKRFGSSGAAVGDALRMALKCGALACGYPDPDRLVGAWLAVSGRLFEAALLLGKVRRSESSSAVRKFARLLVGSSPAIDGLLPWHLATSRRRLLPPVPFQHTELLKRTLQDAIHGFYLQALARLPAGELRSRFHRSMLKAGHCYGPLDPVNNIIINTIWYDAAFPPTAKLDMDFICTLSLHRMENRSLYGLASFLCTRYHCIDFHRAVRCLLKADANLCTADPNLDPDGAVPSLGITRLASQAAVFYDVVDTELCRPDTSTQNAFLAAATAAHHPNPDGQAKFLSSCKLKLDYSSLQLLDGRQLSSQDVQKLARLLRVSHEPHCDKPLPPYPLTGYPLTELVRKHARILKKVNAVLNQTPSGDMYEVQVVCGVNDQVSGPVYCLEGSSVVPHKCCRSHVNFFATPKGAGGAPVLFFAELSNGDEDEAELQSFCCPVSTPPPCAERVRCLYCDYVGTRIVHPIGKDFHGHELEFEDMACGKDPSDDEFDPNLMRAYYTNMHIIDHSRLVADRVIGSLKEDSFYKDSFGFDGDKSDEDGRDWSFTSIMYPSTPRSAGDQYEIPYWAYALIQSA